MLPVLTTYLKWLFETKVQASPEGSDLSLIETVFDWDPMNYVQQNLPAIIIEGMDSALSKMNQYYESTRRIKISVVIATKQFYWAEDQWVVKVKKQVQKIMEGKSDTTCFYNPYSIAWILQNIWCIVIDWCTMWNDLYMDSVQYQNLSWAWFVWYRADMIIRIFNKQIQRNQF